MTAMTPGVMIALALWLFGVLALFFYAIPRRAVLVGLVGGWLFLPELAIHVPGPFPDVSKASVTGLGLVGMVLLMDRTRLLSLRPRWFDLPMLVWCLEPFITALVNGESVYEGISAVLANTIPWGIPYLLGRLYLADADGWRDLARAILFGGLAYIPLCWLEIIAGPHLASLVYGYTPPAVDNAFRFGGWRPIVFMQDGLMVALWMTAASVSGFWLWQTGRLPRLWRLPTGALVVLIVATTFALKSANAWLLLSGGVALLWLSTRWCTPWLAWATLGLIVLYAGVRASGLWDGQELVALTSRALDSKTNSVAFRLENERRLAERARLQPLLGWGRWGRSSMTDAAGNPLATDSLWIIAFGQQGTVGLAALLASLLLPMVFLLRRVPVSNWARPEFAPAVSLAVILTLYTIDNLANAMINPVYMLAAGGLLTLPRALAAGPVKDAAQLVEPTHSPVQTRGT